LEEQKRQYNETRDAENAEKRAQLQKQKAVNEKYQGMTTNLYSGDVSGISTKKLVQ
jgi:hypothetical protein